MAGIITQMKKKLIILAVASVALYVSFAYFPHECDCGLKEEVRIGDATILVDVADTPEERMRGLSDKETLAEGEGMLFVLDEAGTPGFWMKDMRFAIDIIWINSQRRVVGIERDISPETYPETFRPNEAIKYVLEVPAGSAYGHGIDIGDELFFAN